VFEGLESFTETDFPEIVLVTFVSFVGVLFSAGGLDVVGFLLNGHGLAFFCLSALSGSLALAICLELFLGLDSSFLTGD
jgi:hypothetical protein